MRTKPQIGIMADYDPNLWSFARSSGLPADYFHRRRLSIKRAYERILIAAFFLALAAFVFLPKECV